MRIAILTQPLHNNYGGILQNYALQIVLKELGHKPTTLDIAYQKPDWSLYVRITKYIWRLIKKFCGDKSILFCDIERQWFFMNHPGEEQQRFIHANISSLHFNQKLDSSFCEKYSFDAYIVGSDQVWRPRFSPFLLNYFLDFTREQSVRRLSYAASFGTDNWEGSAVDVVDIIPLIRAFDAISVREDSGVHVCWNTFGVNAQCLLDPTLLVPKKTYDSLLSLKESVSDSPYLAVYVLDFTKTIRSLVKRICKEKHLIPLYLGQKRKNGFPSIESWISGIFNSAYVLTDSFHGTVFSVIAHKQFVTVANQGRGVSRFKSFLGKIGLMSRLTSNEQFSLINELIDYQVVDEKLSKLKEESLLFLKQSLNG